MPRKAHPIAAAYRSGKMDSSSPAPHQPLVSTSTSTSSTATPTTSIPIAPPGSILAHIMAEPQPSAVHEGAADPHAPSSTAEDRKAAAALSALDAQDDDSSKKEVDTKALGEAMKNLAVADGKGKGKGEAKPAEAGAAVEKKKAVVKVDAGDVALLVQELDLTKPKATELLRAHEGDAVKALTAFVSASA